MWDELQTTWKRRALTYNYLKVPTILWGVGEYKHSVRNISLQNKNRTWDPLNMKQEWHPLDRDVPEFSSGTFNLWYCFNLYSEWYTQLTRTSQFATSHYHIEFTRALESAGTSTRPPPRSADVCLRSFAERAHGALEAMPHPAWAARLHVPDIIA
jgi:hypothetical protein